MFNIFHANWYIAIGAALIFIITAYVMTRFWGSHRFRSDGQRAIERLKKLERGDPQEPEPAVKPGLSPQIETKVQAVLEREELLEPEPAVKPGLPLQIETKVQAVLEREELLEPEPAVKPGLPLQVGTKVRAVRNFGSVKKGTPGIITRLTDLPLFWWSRPAYLCTFADNMKVHARPKLIEAFDHGYNLEELEQPDFASILSRQMMLRAQQMFSGQRPTRLGNTLIRGALGQ
jgi:hypothetical protein